MSDNETTARHFMEVVLGTGNWDGAEEIIDPKVVMIHPSAPAPVEGFDAVKGMLQGFRAAFPDLRMTAEDSLAVGDKVAVRWKFHGTFTQDLFGMPPTGKYGEMDGTSWFTFANGKIVHDHVTENSMSLFQQLGVIPT